MIACVLSDPQRSPGQGLQLQRWFSEKDCQCWLYDYLNPLNKRQDHYQAEARMLIMLPPQTPHAGPSPHSPATVLTVAWALFHSVL